MTARIRALREALSDDVERVAELDENLLLARRVVRRSCCDRDDADIDLVVGPMRVHDHLVVVELGVVAR